MLKKPGSIVKAEEFVEDDEGPDWTVAVDALVSGKREMHGTVILKSRQSSFSGKSKSFERKALTNRFAWKDWL